MRLIGRSSGRVALTVNSRAPRRYVAPAGRALLFAVLGNGRAGDGTTCRSLIYGSTSSTAACPSAIHPWRLFRPDSHGAHGHWVSNARNALDSGRTGERGGGQHPTPNGHPIANIGRREAVFGVGSPGCGDRAAGRFTNCSNDIHRSGLPSRASWSAAQSSRKGPKGVG
jgi:hypothetical protein